MTIDATEVNAAFLDSLFLDTEIVNGKPPVDAVIVEGVRGKYGFHFQRLGSHRSQVQAWLALLPVEFRANGGGGWSFLNACQTHDGEQWGEHRDMEELFALAIGLGLARWVMPREMWAVLPGGMPYVSIDVDSSRPQAAQGAV
jgi:hypothetical protein